MRLRVEEADLQAAGEYSVVVSNAWGTTSARASLAVQTSGSFRWVRQPDDTAKLAGQDVVWAVGVESVGTPALQWFHDGRLLAGMTNAQWVRTNLTWADAGEYHVEVRQGEARLRSRVARLGVVESGGPRLLKVPTARQPLGLGANGVLSVTAVGWGDLTYAWTQEGELIPGALTNVVSLGPVTDQTAGPYRVEVRDAGGRCTDHAFEVVLAAAARMSGHLGGTGRFQVTLSEGIAGQSYSLLRSVDLVHWTEVAAGVFPAHGFVAYEDDVSMSAAPGGYFRLRVVP
jgi:hypothetical protein